MTSMTAMADAHKAHDGGESPKILDHLARRQKNVTMANQVSITQVKPVDQFRRSSEQVRRAGIHAPRKSGSLARRSGSIEFPGAGSKAAEKDRYKIIGSSAAKHRAPNVAAS